MLHFITIVDLEEYMSCKKGIAFFDDVIYEFLTFNNKQFWCTWDNFENDFRIENNHLNENDLIVKLERFKKLCPDWIFR